MITPYGNAYHLTGKFWLFRLFHTGQEIIVGTSRHTNEAGAQAVARAFPEYATSMIQVRAPFLSLKDAVGVAGINVLAVGQSEAAQKMLKVSLLFMFFLSMFP